MSVLKRITGSAMFTPLLVLLLIVIFNLIVQPGIFSVSINADGNLSGGLMLILLRSVPVMLLALGMTLVIATGGVDLSVGSVLAIGSAVSLSLIRGDTVAPTADTAMALWLVVVITMIVGVVCGLWNGFLVAKIGIPPIVATLIFMVAGRGLTQVITLERSITTGHLPFGQIANGFTLGVQNPIWIAFIIFMMFWLFTRKTAFGLFVESTGINKSAAKYSGIKSTKILLAIYAISGLCASIAGILSASNILAIQPARAGEDMELDAILAVVLGGTNMKGGKFNLGGTVIGAIILDLLPRTMTFLGVGIQYSMFIKAVVIVLIVLIQSPTTGRFVKSLFKTKVSNKQEVAANESV
ncbi:MAG: ABC transporter permease [Oscillospiraceae bacterium]|nr:ABC transporter permease [Oscillospiraceae bacterium]